MGDCTPPPPAMPPSPSRQRLSAEKREEVSCDAAHSALQRRALWRHRLIRWRPAQGTPKADGQWASLLWSAPRQLIASRRRGRWEQTPVWDSAACCPAPGGQGGTTLGLGSLPLQSVKRGGESYLGKHANRPVEKKRQAKNNSNKRAEY
jgi:hypothetical protein